MNLANTNIGTNTCVYIDAANLHRSAKELGFDIDYGRFAWWLKQKFSPKEINMFIGYVAGRQEMYRNLTNHGYKLTFKETNVIGSSVKGNCDGELILKAVSDYYKSAYNQIVLVTGDGDFSCLVRFLKENGIKFMLLGPNYRKCSYLLKKYTRDIMFLNNYYYVFSRMKINPRTGLK